MNLKALVFSALAALPFVSSGPAQAAPQILAALPFKSGLELTCADGICAAQLTTYCLQRERPAPTMGAAYVPAKPEHFTLVLTNDAGNEVRVPAGDHMTFVENRGFMSVAASIELGRLRTLGATDARLVVWEGASLIPVPVPNDPNPLTEEEIAFVTDSLRDVGKEYVDTKPEAMSAKLLAKLNAALPETGAVSQTSFDGMWQQAIGDEIPVPMDGPAMMGARDAYEDCSGRVSTYMYGGLRRCLEYKHDNMIRDLNIDYWQHQPGS